MKRAERVCIVTNYSATANYGAILQAYSLNRYLNQSGYACLTLNPDTRGSRSVSTLLGYAAKPRILLSALKDRLLRFIVRKEIAPRRRAFVRFREEKIPHTKPLRGDGLAGAVAGFDAFICGSDQIWRPGLVSGDFSDLMWLRFVPGEKRKIAYAASTGGVEFNEKQKEYIRQSLKDFERVSLREEQTAELFRKLSGDASIVSVPDPVFLFSAEEWLSFGGDIDIGGPFVFAYFIVGGARISKCAAEFARKKGLRLVTFPYMGYRYRAWDRHFGDMRIFDASPDEFISYISRASYVLTDSFHASAFSIMLHKDFFVFDTNHFTRIASLLEATGLCARKAEASAELCSVPDIDGWDAADAALEVMRSCGRGFLEASLSKKAED